MVKFSDAIFKVLLIYSCTLISCKSDSVAPKEDIKPKEVARVSSNSAGSTSSDTIEAKLEALDSTTVDIEQPVQKTAAKAPKPQKRKRPAKATLKSKVPAIDFKLIRYDFGTIVQGDTVDYKFKFTNSGQAPLEIDSTKVTCGCTQPSYPFMPVEVGEEGYIGVRYVSIGKEGEQEPLISVYTNASKEPTALMMSGIVLTPEQDSIRRIK